MTDDEEPLAQWLALVALGDRAAFRRFYDATASRVHALGLRMLGDPARAEDLLQDVYLRAWYRATDYHPGKGEPLAWLLTIARNRAIDMGRSAHNRDLSLDLAPEPDYSPEEDYSPDQELHGPEVAGNPGGSSGGGRLRYCIDRLEPGQRQSIFCAFFHGLSHSEIAQRFSEPVGTIKTRIRRGLASLKQCLET